MSPSPLPLLEEQPTRLVSLLCRVVVEGCALRQVRELRDREFAGTDYEDIPIIQVQECMSVDVEQI